MGVEQVTGPEVYHGEGPVWYPGWGGLRFVDMLAGDVITLAADGSLERRHVGSVAAAVRPRRDGGAVIGVERGFALEDADGTLTALPELWNDPGVRMNEGGCDPDGRFYCGSMAYDQSVGAASLYRLDPDGSVEVVLNQVTVSNGFEWSPDGSRVYYNDTATFTISVFDYDTAAGLTNRRMFAELPDGGRPDGLTVDGVLEEKLAVPARKVTACTFGGAHLDQLFITTSQENINTREDPLAGSLFRANVGVKGLPVRLFAG
jgi:sugar lactone lactonase YvrE